jgi:hypothetical protein
MGKTPGTGAAQSEAARNAVSIRDWLGSSNAGSWTAVASILKIRFFEDLHHVDQ